MDPSREFGEGCWKEPWELCLDCPRKWGVCFLTPCTSLQGYLHLCNLLLLSELGCSRLGQTLSFSTVERSQGSFPHPSLSSSPQPGQPSGCFIQGIFFSEAPAFSPPPK